MFRAYLPAAGSPSNGKVWPSWLRVPKVSCWAGPLKSSKNCQGATRVQGLHRVYTRSFVGGHVFHSFQFRHAYPEGATRKVR